MSKRNDMLLINDILEGILKIFRYTKDMDFKAYMKDEKTIDAVNRNFEIIGEAANRLSKIFIKENSNIPWVRIRGFRNRIVHEYFGVDNEIIWSIIKNDLNPLYHNLKNLKSN
ncbi:DUF86 domain-containing protein [Gramella sp. AN32]|uniref:DUF86 domain-containing protein n=1 Tax=Christiangramia antarctica TaxID=2058158 RepID=A0ABW5X7V3_9FLAO|nr:DUF86 domain-containing protein [Gramella sp. AN32]MCM4156093.1 hypothetical protein [Gramella sp. AN32]